MKSKNVKEKNEVKMFDVQEFTKRHTKEELEAVREFVKGKAGDIRQLKKVQYNMCDMDPYMMGLYNGLELAKSILTDKQPKYYASCRIEESGGEYAEYGA